MPLYEYECDGCGERFEVIQKFSDSPPEACRKCGKGPIRRLFSSPAIQFKGSGWYVTDYQRKGSGAGLPDRSESDKKKDSEDKGTGKSVKEPKTKSEKKD